jgi:two-component system response regulator (stage 0 sporulation protein F)
MVVDDELDVREFSRNFFIKRGIEVLLASDGAEALRLLEQDRPDLILLDIRMQGMDGMDFIRELKRRNIVMKIVIVSSIEDAAIIREAESLGVLGFIQKPLVLDELKKAVLAHLG